MRESDRHTPEFLSWAAGRRTPAVPNLNLAPNPRLAAAGWERRFTAGHDRLEEAAALYRELGFEVHIESIEPDELSEICGDCRLATCFAYQTIYTRKLQPDD